MHAVERRQPHPRLRLLPTRSAARALLPPRPAPAVRLLPATWSRSRRSPLSRRELAERQFRQTSWIERKPGSVWHMALPGRRATLVR